MGLVLELNFKTYLNCFLLFAFLDEDTLDIYLGESRKLNKLILLTFSLLKILIEYK